MLASATAVVLCLALGAAPVPALEIRPGEPRGAPSDEARSPTPPTDETASPKPSTPEAPSPEVPSPEVPSPEVPSPEVPSPDEPSNDGEPTDAPSTSEPSNDGDPTNAPSPDDPPSDVEPTDEPLPEDDDPFGDHSDEDPWPDDDAGNDAGDEADTAPLPDYDPLRDSPEALRARRWVHTGIGTIAAGGALLVGAIIIGASDPCHRRAGNSCQVDARNRAALVMGIPAALLVGGGAAMLGIGKSRQRRLAVDLQASRTSMGITVRGRF
jgi:hypothetical protein